MQKNRFVLIDGNAIVHRAYHALPKLTTKDGKLVNAVYGFTNMLLKIIDDLRPTHLAVAFDRPEPTFRKKMYEEYQAQRPEMDEELTGQFPIIKAILETMKIPIFEKAGYEADDVIGTLAYKTIKQSGRKLIEIIIVTGDRDILQLVNETIKVYMPVKGLSQAKLFGIRETEDKYGISPSQINDYKALVGDASDNYPGVSGVGPKTAVKLLRDYNSLENIYKNIEDIEKESLQKMLKEKKNDARMSKELSTIVTDIPITIDISSMNFESVNTPDVIELFRQLGFKKLIERLLLNKNDGLKKNVSIKEDKRRKRNENQLSLI